MFRVIAAAQRENLILWVPVFLGLGIGVYFALSHEPPVELTATLIFTAALAAFYAWWRERQVTVTLLLALAFFLVAAGWGVAQVRTVMVKAPVLTREIDPAMVEGTIRSIDTLKESKGVRLILQDVAIEKLPPARTPALVRVSFREDDDFEPGERIKVLAGLSPPSPPVSPGSFDFQRNAYFQRLGAYGFAYGRAEVVTAVKEPPLSGALERFRHWESRRINSYVSQPEAAIVSALLLGERSGIPDDTWDDIRTAGLAHVIVIAGLHIGMVAGGIFFFTRLVMALFPRFALYHPIKKYAAGMAMAGAIFYAVMVGLAIPALRAVMMTSAAMVAIMFDRSPLSMRLLALAATVILLTTPEAIVGPSFQMSFAAVSALIFFYDETRSFWAAFARRGGMLNKMAFSAAGIGATSLVATVATAPFTLYHFQQFPVYSVLGNILVLPIIGFVVMPAAVVTYLLIPFGLDRFSLWVMEQGIAAMLYLAHFVSTLPFATWPMAAWPLGGLMCFAAAGLLTMILKGRIRLIAAAPLLVGFLIVMLHHPPDIIVASSAKLAMIRTGDHSALLSNRRSDKFAAKNWLLESGIDPDEVETWPKEGVRDQGNAHLACDPYGCLATVKGRTVAVSFEPRTLTQDCKAAQIVISMKPLAKDSCAAPVKIGMWDLKDNGAVAFWLDDRGITVRTVNGVRGVRPWTSGAERYSRYVR